MVKVPANAGITHFTTSQNTSEKSHLRAERYRDLSEGQVLVEVIRCGVECGDAPADGDRPGSGPGGGVVRGVGRVRAAESGPPSGYGDL